MVPAFFHLNRLKLGQTTLYVMLVLFNTPYSWGVQSVSQTYPFLQSLQGLKLQTWQFDLDVFGDVWDHKGQDELGGQEEVLQPQQQTEEQQGSNGETLGHVTGKVDMYDDVILYWETIFLYYPRIQKHI